MTAAVTNFGNGFRATGYAGSSTIGPVKLLGGKYALSVVDTGTADVTLSALGPDGTTYIACNAAIVANGLTALDLPAGAYEVTTGTGTLAAVSLIPIPYRRAV